MQRKALDRRLACRAIYARADHTVRVTSYFLAAIPEPYGESPPRARDQSSHVATAAAVLSSEPPPQIPVADAKGGGGGGGLSSFFCAGARVKRSNGKKTKGAAPSSPMAKQNPSPKDGAGKRSENGGDWETTSASAAGNDRDSCIVN